jgi:hypothetical protein
MQTSNCRKETHEIEHPLGEIDMNTAVEHFSVELESCPPAGNGVKVSNFAALAAVEQDTTCTQASAPGEKPSSDLQDGITRNEAEARARALAIEARQRIESIWHQANKLCGMLPGCFNVEVEDPDDPGWADAHQQRWTWLDHAGEFGAGLRQLGAIMSRAGVIDHAFFVAGCLVGDGTNEKQERNRN